MCRWTFYKGHDLLLGDLILKPNNSLVRQARNAEYHPGVVDDNHKRNILVNGDGFGCAWYGADPSRGSCVFKFVTPAWSNSNLRNLGDYVSANVIMAHVRAATSGHNPREAMIVSNENCHPFKFKRWTFMHNGGIHDFKKIQRKLLNDLSEEVYNNISGCTDSEHIFALFLSYLPTTDEAVNIEVLITTVERTIQRMLDLCDEFGIAEPMSLNCVFSDGINVVATRYRNGRQIPPTLYYKYGSNFACAEDGRFDCDSWSWPSEVCISSAPLSCDGSAGAAGFFSGEDFTRRHQNRPRSNSEPLIVSNMVGVIAAQPSIPSSPNDSAQISVHNSVHNDMSTWPNSNSSLLSSSSSSSSKEVCTRETKSSSAKYHCPPTNAASSVSTTATSTSSSSTKQQIDQRPQSAAIPDKSITSNIGSCEWILVPKDHMLVCVGDSNDMSKVSQVSLRRIEVNSLRLPAKTRASFSAQKWHKAVKAAVNASRNVSPTSAAGRLMLTIPQPKRPVATTDGTIIPTIASKAAAMAERGAKSCCNLTQLNNPLITGDFSFMEDGGKSNDQCPCLYRGSYSLYRSSSCYIGCYYCFWSFIDWFGNIT